MFEHQAGELLQAADEMTDLIRADTSHEGFGVKRVLRRHFVFLACGSMD